jgi:hypothetical protein
MAGPQAMPLDPSLDEAMTRVQGNISQLLANSGRPSVGDVGRSLLMSAAYRGAKPHTEFLAEDQARQYEMVGAQANMVSQAVQMRLEQAKAKAGSNPSAEFFAKDLEAMIANDPAHAERFMARIEADPEPYSIQQHAKIKAETAPPPEYDVPEKVTWHEGDTEYTQFYNDQGPMGEPITAPRYKPEGAKVEVKLPSPVPGAPSGYYYSQLNPETPGGIKLEKIPGGPPENSTESGRLAALDIAKQDIALAKSIMMPEGEKSMSASLTGDWNIPFTAGRRAKTAMRRSLDTLAKFKTGAAMNEDEAQDYLDTYMPKPGDSQKEAADKFLRFEQFIEESFKRSGTTPNLKTPVDDTTLTMPTLEDIDNMNEQQLDEFLSKHGG